MTGSELNQFYFDANDVAKQMGVTTKEIIEQASAWSRLGYSSKEASTEMAQLSSQFASISPGMATDDAQNGLVSIMKADIHALMYRNVHRRIYLIAGNVLEPCTTIIRKLDYDGLKTQGLAVHATKYPNVSRRSCGT